MTTPSTERKAGPLLGTGAQTTWPFTFKVFTATDIAVTIADSLGVETALTYGVDYTVTLNANQETSPGGTVTYPISGSPLPTGSRLVIVGNLPYDQPLDLPAGGNFSPLALENELDRLTMQIQQLREKVSRALQVSVTTGANVGLPAPSANELIGWDSTGQNLQNFAVSELATAVAYATMRYDTFTGDGVETQFTLTADPITLANLDVAISGVTQVPGSDYSLVSGVLVFASAPANGTEILARYGEGLVNVGGDSSDIRFLQAGAGAVDRTVQDKLREFVSVKDFGAVGDGAVDDTAAIQAAIDAAGNRDTFFPTGSYKISSSLVLRNGSHLVGEGDPTGDNAAAISPLGANFTNATFAIFIKSSGALSSASLERIRTWGGGYGLRFDLSSGSVAKIDVRDCVFQSHLTAAIAGTGATSGAGGIFVSNYDSCTFLDCAKGIYSTGAFNINRVENCGFEQMSGAYLHLADPAPLPSSSVIFKQNRCETVGSVGAAHCVQLDGTVFNATIEDNYFENTFTSLLKAVGVRGLVFARNFHTNDAVTTGAIELWDSEFVIEDNTSLVGVNLTFYGTTNRVQSIRNNLNYNVLSMRGTTAAAAAPLYIPSQGISLDGVPTIYKGRLAQTKFVNLTNNVFADFLVFTGGSDAGAGFPSRAGVSVRLLVLTNVTDDGGVNRIHSAEYIITARCFAGATMQTLITQLANDSGGLLTLQQKTGANATSVTVEGKLSTGANFASGSRAVLLYEYIADETASSGLSIS